MVHGWLCEEFVVESYSETEGMLDPGQIVGSTVHLCASVASICVTSPGGSVIYHLGFKSAFRQTEDPGRDRVEDEFLVFFCVST